MRGGGLASLLALIGAALACNAPTNAPDIDATLAAGVTQTLAARDEQTDAPTANSTPAGADTANRDATESAEETPRPAASAIPSDLARPNGAPIFARLRSTPPDSYQWFPPTRAGKPDGVRFAAERFTGGFTLEVAVPWQLYSIAPHTGDRFGFAVSLSDNDSPGTCVFILPSPSTERGRGWGDVVIEHSCQLPV